MIAESWPDLVQPVIKMSGKHVFWCCDLEDLEGWEVCVSGIRLRVSFLHIDPLLSDQQRLFFEEIQTMTLAVM